MMAEIDRDRARGGKTVYGACVGILILETRFPRIPGDIGHAMTWPFPVLYKVVRGATAERVTTAKANDRSTGLLDAFLAAGAELVRDGADGITTSCGFLSIYQRELAEHCGVPVAASSLTQIPLVERLLPPGRRVGVLTFSKARLSPDHFLAAGAAPDTPVVGADNGREFYRVIEREETVLDIAAARADILAAGDELVARHPEVGAVVLECTNMVPFARALHQRLGLPVWDIYSFVTWFHAGLSPRGFPVQQEQ
jgi:Asp/Glu/hydantoin racemase